MELGKPTLLDWYITDQSGRPVDKKSFLRMIEKYGILKKPEFNLGVVGKKFFEGDDPAAALGVFSPLSLIECKGHGRFHVMTDCCQEYNLHRDRMASRRQIDEMLNSN